MTDTGAANPFRTVAAAARGDVEAQRAMAHAAMLRFYDDNGQPLSAENIGVAEMAALIEGLAFARMAASHGDPSDRNRLVAMLSLGHILPSECAVPILGEMIARASMLTDDNALHGDDAEAVDLSLQHLSAEVPREAVATASTYRQLIQESEAA